MSAEFTLFDVVSNSISVSVEASHQWTETGTITRQSTVDIPPNGIAHLWLVPVVGKVTGTLVVSDGVVDVHRNQLLRDAQWGDQGCAHAGV